MSNPIKLLMILSMLIVSTITWADDYTITSNVSQQNTIAFFAVRLSLTNTQTLQQMCDAGIVPYFQLRTKLDAEAANQAFQQLLPARQAVVCAELATVGYTCPSGP